jgi:signal transduction histidine kinase
MPMMRGLKTKVLLLTLLPILIVSSAISGVAIYNQAQTERQALLDRLITYRTLLESGDLSFDTVQDKERLKDIIGEEVALAEILRRDYSVIYSSEDSIIPLITEDEKRQVDDAFDGIETVSTQHGRFSPAFSLITPLVVNGRIVAVLHEHLSNSQSSARVARYAAFVVGIELFGLAISFLSVYLLLTRAVVRNITRLKEATIDLQKGNFDKSIEVHSSDEIGELASSFNVMTERLRDYRQNVENKVRELSEEHGKISSLVESIKLGVVMVDLSLRVVLSNPAARAVFGKDDGEELVFRDVADKIKGKVNISQALSSYVRAGKPLNIQEVMIGGSYYRLFMSPVRDIVQKMFIGAVFIMEDISEQKKLDQVRSEIVSITSHQLRTPATIIKGNLEMVLGGDFGKITKKQQELLEDTYMGNQRMIRLVNDLMDASKIDEGKFELPKESVDFSALVAEAMKEVAPFADKHEVDLSLASTDKLPLANINRAKVKQVLQNLMDNAIKYSGVGGKAKGEGRVEVSLERDGGFIKLTVKDNGIGIPEADQKRIFERFYRGANSSKLDPGGGSGLGLYIAKGVVEQGGGKLWFDSKEGEGTSFHATFPTIG